MRFSSGTSRPPQRFAGLTRWLADFIAHRTGCLIALALGIAALALYVTATRKNLDSEVLDLLPPQFESVRGLKVFNNEFSQARQMVLAFVAEEGHADDIEPFKEHFMAELKRQPWVVRTFDRIPLETEEGLKEVQGLVPVLLLNLPLNDFKDAMALLEPQAIQERLTRLRESLTGDSIRSQIEAQVDPLGLFARAMKPFGAGAAMDQGSSLTSADGLLQIALFITNQPELGPKECQEVMDKLNAFKERMLREWTGYKPRVLVTGRTAYVAEISRSMDHDGIMSSTLSILIVSGLFYLAFRRFLPLVAIVLILGLSALSALALGMLVFRNLNMIAIGFCSILVGLGVDFSLLLFGRYLQARRAGDDHARAVFVSVRDIGAAVFYVVVTTAIGFLALSFSKSSGFAQLGTLVAFGVAFAGLFMTLFLFMFFKRVRPSTSADILLIGATRYVESVFRRPKPLLAVSATVLAIAAVIALLPVIPLEFDTNPRSLEPKQSQASIALRTIADKLNQESDPITIVVDARDPQEFHDRWEKLTNDLLAAQGRGELKRISTPVALALSPRRFAETRAYLQHVDLAAAAQSVRTALEQNGFDLDAFQPVFGILQQLDEQKHQTGLPDWSKLFPQSSSWWFFIERYFSDRPTRAVGFVYPSHPIRTEAEQRQFLDLVHRSDPQAIVTGWTFTLFDLVPWAKGELIMFTTGVGVTILVLLWVVYRRWSLWLIHASALLFSMLGMIASLKLLHLPINLLNALAFPLVLAIGVDYGIQFLVVSRREGDLRENLANVLKPLSICGLATIAGFAVLIPTQNPALSGLGIVCTTGVVWCALSTFFYMVPAFALLQRKRESTTVEGGTPVRV
ncbi:MAG: MMPL family transporter [Verrucomicrobia bacterium]|nr:MMPL family transporter [Verrucomicrobiota bacterium]